MSHDRMQRQRFEFKYVLEEATALEVRDYVNRHLDLDEAGVGKPNYAYPVNSIYLDSPSLLTFWDWVNADRNRFKLRMRYYDESPNTPVYLEIKRRVANCILKQRCALQKAAAPYVVAGQMPPEKLICSDGAKQRVALVNFVNLVARLNASPRALVTYLREAYIDPINEGVRVTLDREVRIAERTTPDFSLHMPEHVQPFGNKVILELKFNNRFPNWFGQMTRMLRLSRSAAAKYCEGMASIQRPQFSNWSNGNAMRRNGQNSQKVWKSADEIMAE